MTGELFPTGQRTDTITINERSGLCFSVRATLVDAANPFVIVDAATLPSYLKTCAKDSIGYLQHMESIRRAGAVMMGLASSTEVAAKVRGTPKLALVSAISPQQASKDRLVETGLSIQVSAFSMGKAHPSLQLTGAACLASAVCIEGTVAHRIASDSKSNSLLDHVSEQHIATELSYSLANSTTGLPTPAHSTSPSSHSSSGTSSPTPPFLCPQQRKVRIFHASGAVEVGVAAACSRDWAVVERCSVSRTARRLFDGTVYYYQ